MSQEWSTPSSGASANTSNYLVPAILSTVFCCPPVGIISIIFAAQVNSKIAAGDIAGATESSGKAKMFMFVAVGLGLLSWIVGILLWILVFGAAIMSNM
jgi:uncharacterized membrane protein